MHDELVIRTPIAGGSLLILLSGWIVASMLLSLWRQADRLLSQVMREKEAAQDDYRRIFLRIEHAKGFARWAILPLLRAPDGERVAIDKNALSLVLQDLGMDSHGNALPPEEDDEEEFYGDE